MEQNKPSLVTMIHHLTPTHTHSLTTDVQNLWTPQRMVSLQVPEGVPPVQQTWADQKHSSMLGMGTCLGPTRTGQKWKGKVQTVIASTPGWTHNRNPKAPDVWSLVILWPWLHWVDSLWLYTTDLLTMNVTVVTDLHYCTQELWSTTGAHLQLSKVYSRCL